MYKSKKMEDFGKMNEKERIEQQKNYERQLRKEVKAIFEKYLISTVPFDKLKDAKKSDEHIQLFQAIQYNTDPVQFDEFVNALIDKDMIEYYDYGIAFNFNIGMNWYGYSPLLNALLEIEDYIIPVEITKKYKTYISDYLSSNELDISQKRFEDFKFLTKRVDWPQLIRYSIEHGNFGNDSSREFIKNALNDIFLKDTSCRYYKSGGIEGLISVISYGLFDDVKLIDRIALGDKTLDVSDEMITFLREYCLFESDTMEDRYSELHSKHAIKHLPRITIHGLEEFYWFLRKQVSDKTRLLLAMK